MIVYSVTRFCFEFLKFFIWNFQNLCIALNVYGISTLVSYLMSNPALYIYV